MYQIFGTQAIQTAHYILHAHIVLFIACVCMHMRVFFFHSNQEDRAIIMFKPHLYFECERMSTEKKLKLCRKNKNKNKTALFVLHTKAHIQSLLSSCKRTKTVNFQCHFLDFIKHTQTFQHWVSYLHVIPAYWYSTKGNIPSSVRKITMKQSKIILAEVPELKK